MKVVIAILVAWSIFGAALAPLWFHFLWRRTGARWLLSPADRLFVEMVEDLASEDCWEGSRSDFTHRDSGVMVHISYGGSGWVSVGGETVRFSYYHPLTPSMMHLKRRMAKRDSHARSNASLAKLSDAFRRMNSSKASGETPNQQAGRG